MKIVKGISWFVILIIFLFAFLLVGCDKSNQAANGLDEAALLTKDPNFSQQGTSAICLSTVHLREKPDTTSKWLGALVPGLMVNFLNKTESGPVYKDKNDEWVNGEWFYVETPDNKKGWALADLVAENSTPAVIIEETSTYTMPSEVSLAPDKLKPMDAIAIVGEKDGGWVKVIKVMGLKNKTYWIKSNAMSKQGSDFAAAVLFLKENNSYASIKDKKEKDKEDHIRALKDIKGVAGSNSVFTSIIDEELQKLGAASAQQDQPVKADEAPATENTTTTSTDQQG